MQEKEQRKVTQGRGTEAQLVLSLIKSGLIYQRELGNVSKQFALNANQFVVINQMFQKSYRACRIKN